MSRSYLAILGDVRGGAVVSEASDEIAKIVEAAIASGKAGSITIKLAITPHGAGQNGFFIQDTITAVLPKMPKDRTVMFADAEGNLQRRDPRQPDLPLSPVTAVSAV